MSQISGNPAQRLFVETMKGIAEGVCSFAPLVSLFKIRDTVMTLDRHYQLLPLYSATYPQKMLLMIARQLGKTTNLGTSNFIRSATLPFYHSLVIQPRFDQIVRFNATIYQPVGNSCMLQKTFIKDNELSRQALKRFNNGSITILGHAYLSVNHLRGLSGLACVWVDESVPYYTEVITIQHTSEGDVPVIKQIKDIKKGETCISFLSTTMSYAIVSKDASYHGVRKCFRITTRSGRAVDATEDHCLPTNMGRLSVKDIIEYARDRDDGTPEERSTGIPDGGCNIQGFWKGDKGDHLESWSEAVGVCATQIHGITKCRHERTVYSEESGLRRILSNSKPEEYEDISLLVFPDASGWVEDKGSYKGVLRSNNPPNSTGMVVSGRRIKADEYKQRKHSNKRISAGECPASPGVVDEPMGNRDSYIYSTPLVHREGGPNAKTPSCGVCQTCRSDISLCPPEHELQDKDSSCSMSALRKSGRTWTEPILLGGVQKNCQTRTVGTSETGSGEVCFCKTETIRIPEGTSRREESQRARETTKSPGRKKRRTSSNRTRKSKEVPGIASGRGECQETGKTCKDEGRSRIRKEVEGGTQKILRKEKTESGSLRRIYSETESICEFSGKERKREGASSHQERKGSGAYQRVYEGSHCEEETAYAGGPGICEEVPGCSEQVSERKEGGSPERTRRRGISSSTERKVQTEEIGRNSGAETSTSRQKKCHVEETAGKKAYGEGFLDPIVSIEYIGELPVYDIEVEGIHNYVLANGICSYNCQDINRDFLPIVQETMSASEHWATLAMAGTPTTTDTTLGLEWEESSQAEWVTKCQHCNHYNIPNPRQDIVKMIGKNGSICAKCGRPLNPIYGNYVHAYPDRQFTYPGYHISQTIHPMHCMNPRKWPDLLYKVEKYSEMALYNEVFGWPYDISVVPLTKKDVLESRNKHNYDKPEDIPNNLRDSYRYISVGIDWDGGGALSVSFTNIAVCGLRNNSNVIDCIYGERIKKGKKAKDVSRYIMGILDKVQPDIVGYDAGGAGFLYRQIMIEEGFNELLSIPFKYSSPSSGDVIRYHKGVRDDNAYYYSIDKSRSLSILIEAVKAKAVTNPWFEDNDDTVEPLELLALIEMPKTTATGDTVYLIGKKSGVPDDYAHALNFGCAAIWDHFNNYPKLGDRYDTSALVEDEELQKKEELWDDLSDWSKYLGEINGPTFTPGGF